MTKIAESNRDEFSARPGSGELSGFPVNVKHILAPTDLSEDSRKGLRYATWVASQFNAKLTVLHVVGGRPGLDYSLSEDERRKLQVAEQKLNSIVEDIEKAYPEIEASVLIGNVCSQIADLAKLLKSDLIVVSSHNYPWFKRLMTGSGAEKIARHAPCPILIVHKQERDFVD